MSYDAFKSTGVKGSEEQRIFFVSITDVSKVIGKNVFRSLDC